MSKIRQILNHDKLSPDLKNLFGHIVKLYDNQNSPNWEQLVFRKDERFHRENLLKRGLINFDFPDNGLTPYESVLLYSYYYLPMHFMSSFLLYYRESTPIEELLLSNKRCYFIDFGSGTFTSILAFAAVEYMIKTSNDETSTQYSFNGVTYFALDQSKTLMESMTSLNLLFKFNENKNYDFFVVSSLIQNNNWEQVYAKLDHYISDKKDYSILLNFSYFFASPTLDTNSLINIINYITIVHHKATCLIFFQNPTPEFLNEKWEHFKSQLPQFKTVVEITEDIPYFHNSKVKYETMILDNDFVYKLKVKVSEN